MGGKSNTYVKYILVFILLLAVGIIVLTNFIQPDKKHVDVLPPKLDSELIDLDSLRRIQDGFEHDRSIWSQQKEKLLSDRRKMNQKIQQLKMNRKANNDDIKDDQLLLSIDQSLLELKKRGY